MPGLGSMFIISTMPSQLIEIHLVLVIRRPVFIPLSGTARASQSAIAFFQRVVEVFVASLVVRRIRGIDLGQALAQRLRDAGDVARVEVYVRISVRMDVALGTVDGRSGLRAC